MGFFRNLMNKLFGLKQGALVKLAGNLPGLARLHAKTTVTALIDHFPMMLREGSTQKSVENWDFVLTIAGVTMAFARLRQYRRPPAQDEKLAEIIFGRLDEMYPDGSRAVLDCTDLFHSEYHRLAKAGHGPSLSAYDAVGIWIVWNGLGRKPQTEEECRLVRVTGQSVTTVTWDYWE